MVRNPITSKELAMNPVDKHESFGSHLRRLSRRVVRGLVLPAFALTACDGLLDVELPGDLVESDLNDPAMATTLALSAQGDFECMFRNYVFTGGAWATEFLIANNSRPLLQVTSRSHDWIEAPQNSCDDILALWLPLNTARVQAENAVVRIQQFGDAVPNRDYLIGLSYAYAGYAYQLAGEAFCELAFDNGPLVTREETFRIAEQRFTSALEHARRSTDPDARSIVNMALVGRARARLNLGDAAGVVEDASQVDEGFVRYATASSTTGRRYNTVYVQNNEGRAVSIAPEYRGLTVDGVPDPRVRLEHYGEGTGFDNLTDMWGQTKYMSRGSPMPFSTWREAQLMIAEVEGGQTAVNIINRLRETFDLPPFSSTDEAEIRAQVREERRRELFLQGTRIGDKLRWNEPWATGVNQRGEPYSDRTCIPLVTQEILGNPHI